MNILFLRTVNFYKFFAAIFVSIVFAILVEFFLFQKNFYLLFQHNVITSYFTLDSSSLICENIYFEGNSVISLKNPSFILKKDSYSFVRGVYFKLGNFDSRKIQIKVFCSDENGNFSDEHYQGKISLNKENGYIPVGHNAKDLKIIIGDDYCRYSLESIVLNPNLITVAKNMDLTRLLRLTLVGILFFFYCFFKSYLTGVLNYFYPYLKKLQAFSLYGINVVTVLSQSVLFFYFFTSFLDYNSLVTLYIPHFFYKLFSYLLISLCLYKLLMMIYDKKTRLALICSVIAVLLYFVYYVSYSGTFIYEFIFLAICCYKLGYRSVLFTYCFGVGLVISAEIILMLTGVLKDIAYIREAGGYRHSFGSIYPTDFACSILFVLLSFWASLKRSFCVVSVILLALFIYFQSLYTITRNSELLMVLSIIFIIIYSLFENRKEQLCHSYLLSIPFKYAFLFLAFLSLLLAYLYNDSNPFLVNLDKIFSSRLSLVHSALNTYSLSFWGQYIILFGNGGSMAAPETYNFIDSSYCLLLIRYGIVCFFIFALMYTYTQKRFLEQGNLKLSIVFLLIAVHSFTEHHYIEFFYNPFLLLFIADVKEKSDGLGEFEKN